MKVTSKQLDILLHFGLAILGMTLFSAAFNLLIQPLHFFSGGIIGVAQIIQSALRAVGLSPASFDLAGIIYYIINIPLLILAWRYLGRFFFIRTILLTTYMTILLTLIPIPVQPLIDDPLTVALIAGVLCGIGTGLTLYAGYSAGGMDIIGLYFTKKYRNFSVGKITIIVNLLVFTILAATQDIEVVVYSFLFNAVASVAIDRVHAQNINVWVVIFTKKEGVDQVIMTTTGRGVTSWDGSGAYTGQHTFVHTAMINKMEIPLIRRLVLGVDPKAFIIMNEGSQVVGNFEKRL